MHKTTDHRILVVVSSDFGELGTAMYMLEGTGIKAQLLLPTWLYQHNYQLAPHKVCAYSGAAQLLEKIRDDQPQLLLLMSGVNSLLSVVDLHLILQQARSMKISVATTDPFLGIPLSEEAVHPLGRTNEGRKHAEAQQICLRDVHHLYVSPVPSRHFSHSFFNPMAVISKAQQLALLAGLQQGPLNSDRPHWFFVISNTDYQLQCALYGRLAFEGMLFEKIQQTLGAHRQPVLLAPTEACQALRGRLGGDTVLLPFCGYEQFRALLITAEHVIYWNVMSNSVLVRIINGGSVFFMDEGHLARYIPSLVGMAMKSYFANAPLPMLDPKQVLTTDDLAQRALAQPETFAPSREALQRLSSSQTLLTFLCGAAGA